MNRTLRKIGIIYAPRLALKYPERQQPNDKAVQFPATSFDLGSRHLEGGPIRDLVAEGANIALGVLFE